MSYAMEYQIMAQNAMVEALKKKRNLDLSDTKAAEQLESARLALRYMVIDMARQGELAKAESLIGDQMDLRSILKSLRGWPQIT